MLTSTAATSFLLCSIVKNEYWHSQTTLLWHYKLLHFKRVTKLTMTQLVCEPVLLVCVK